MPAIILNFMSDIKADEAMITLRPLYMAYETKEQVGDILVETMNRLSAASGGSISAKELWEKIDAIMTDAASKNLDVAKGAASKLKSQHIPKHLFCKSHTCEKLDEACINVLVQMEKK